MEYKYLFSFISLWLLLHNAVLLSDSDNNIILERSIVQIGGLKMSIQIYIGTLGSGKTLSMVRDLYIDYTEKKRKIISNLVLTFNSEIISKEFFNGFAQGQQQELFDVSLGIDEFHIFLDSRSSTTKASKYLSYFILQTRKRGVELRGTVFVS